MEKPPFIHKEIISDDWVDYNGHMNVAYYVLVFDHATDVLLSEIGIDETYRLQTGGSVFVVESHITYEREVMSGETVEISAHIINSDDKRLHLFMSMWAEHSEQPAATIDTMILHMDLNTRRTAPFPERVTSKLLNLQEDHSKYPLPGQLGRKVGFIKKG